MIPPLVPRWLLISGVGLVLGGIFALGVLPSVIPFGLAFLAIVPVALYRLYQRQRKSVWKILVLASPLLILLLAVGLRTHFRYRTATLMSIPVQEYTNDEYPEDPADRSVNHNRYQSRELVLIQKDDTHFDFVFEPQQPHVAKVIFRNIDVSLMTPDLPEWTKQDDGLRRIALTDRQWNRQQVRFDVGSPHLEVTGGDGFEKENILTGELAKNCLNAGLWEVLLFLKEDGGKKLYYQGWFTFPLGHYKNLWERGTGLSYWTHWYYLEHWFDPAGTVTSMDKLRRVTAEWDAPVKFDGEEKIFTEGEQQRKRRTSMAQNAVRWSDFYNKPDTRFASFIPPGRYSVNHPRDTKYWKLDRFEKVIMRSIVSPATDQPLQELELVFTSTKEDGSCHFFVSGIDLSTIPQLPRQNYPSGMYMPMGIGVPPFAQSYEDLQRKPPQQSPYVSVLLDQENRWIDHHSLGIDGPVLYRDDTDPDLLHVLLLSYERHSLVGHFVVSTRTGPQG